MNILPFLVYWNILLLSLLVVKPIPLTLHRNVRVTLQNTTLIFYSTKMVDKAQTLYLST